MQRALQVASIEQCIRILRGQRVILDHDLAPLYGVSTKALVQAVKRNRARFPPDFMLRLTSREFEILRSQIVTSRSHGGRRYRPLAFTEQGVAMLSSVLRSPRAISVNIVIMRAFVRLRELATSNRELTLRLDRLEHKYDRRFKVVFTAIRELITPAAAPPRRIGFTRV